MLPKTSTSSPEPAASVRLWLLCLAMLPLLIWASPGRAFEMNSDAPITVKANQARLDDIAGKATYTGDVLIVQGKTRLFADRVELYRDQQGLSRIEAFGDPARYEQPESPEAAAIDARAQEIEFVSADSLLKFRNEAIIRQAGDVFRGDIIQYHTEDRVVTAERAQSGSGSQVEMVIQPRRSGETGNSGPGGSNGAAEGQ